MPKESDSVLVVNKLVGETPLECISRFRNDHPEYLQVKMTYAGRLDPMAEGVLLVLAGDMVHKKDDFTKLPKVYECTAILGIETDTYDVLGIPVSLLQNSTASQSLGTSSWQEEEIAPEKLSGFVGTFTQPYPPYSSKTINGKQMHTIAREGGFDDLVIPSQEVTVNSISNIRMVSMAIEDLVQEITQNVEKVTGDFRQIETIKAWEAILEENKSKRISLVMFTVEVSGGTYIRGIVHELGQKLGIGACIIRLKRTNVGEYRLN